MTYVLEVVRFNEEGWLVRGTKHEHIGYMNIYFETKQDAYDYYNKHNKHMRHINLYGTYCSDWDPKTKLLYIVRKNYSIYATIPPFNPNDATKIVRKDNSCTSYAYEG